MPIYSLLISSCDLSKFLFFFGLFSHICVYRYTHQRMGKAKHSHRSDRTLVGMQDGRRFTYSLYVTCYHSVPHFTITNLPLFNHIPMLDELPLSHNPFMYYIIAFEYRVHRPYLPRGYLDLTYFNCCFYCWV